MGLGIRERSSDFFNKVAENLQAHEDKANNAHDLVKKAEISENSEDKSGKIADSYESKLSLLYVLCTLGCVVLAIIFVVFLYMAMPHGEYRWLFVIGCILFAILFAKIGIVLFSDNFYASMTMDLNNSGISKESFKSYCEEHGRRYGILVHCQGEWMKDGKRSKKHKEIQDKE